MMSLRCPTGPGLPSARTGVMTPKLTSPLAMGIRLPKSASRSNGIVRAREPVQEGQLDFLEVSVPRDQRPSNELQQLKEGMLYSWGELPVNEFGLRIFGLYAVGFLLLGGPISFQTFNPTQQPIEFFLAGSTGTMIMVAIVVARIFLGWSYVSDRLLSAAIPYEETGWYDGETFVKPPEILTRDRLLGMYETKPVLRKLKGTLIGTAATLVISTILLVGFVKAGADEDGRTGRGAAYQPRMVTSAGPIFSKEVGDLSVLAEDDELAAAEAAAAGGVPGYCRDRLLKAYAGGQYCKSLDL